MSSRPDPTVVSLFSGCGGSSLGYEMAGFRVLMAADCDPHAVETYRANFDTPVYDGDVCGLTAEQVQEMSGVVPGELDVLDGSPPCQGFSMAGKRQMGDGRNLLFLEYVRLLRALQPRVFVMENVMGMVRGKQRLVFREIHNLLGEAGYSVVARRLNAVYLGVPQIRERVIIVGTRADLEIDPKHPKPFSPPMPVIEAFDDLPEDAGRTLNDKGYAVWRCTDPGRSFSTQHPKGHWWNACKLHPFKPAPTLTSMVSIKGGYGAGIFHWKHPRALNAPELKRISSFPDDFVVHGGLVKTWNRLGDAVPPRMMKAIAGTIRSEILEVSER